MKVFAALVFVMLVACDTEKAGPPEPPHPGEVAFKQQCALCHTTDGSTSTGPTLLGVVGRPAASLPGFAYTKAMKKSRLNWDAETLDVFLANPMAKVPGSMMVTAVPDPAQRAAIIEYLQTLKTK